MPVPTCSLKGQNRDNSLGTRDQIDRKWGPDSRKVATLQFYTKSVHPQLKIMNNTLNKTFEVIAEHHNQNVL